VGDAGAEYRYFVVRRIPILVVGALFIFLAALSLLFLAGLVVLIAHEPWSGVVALGVAFLVGYFIKGTINNITTSE
jgi:hypothetical protein